MYNPKMTPDLQWTFCKHMKINGLQRSFFDNFFTCKRVIFK